MTFQTLVTTNVARFGPRDLRAVAVTEDSVDLRWTPDPCAEEYAIDVFKAWKGLAANSSPLEILLRVCVLQSALLISGKWNKVGSLLRGPEALTKIFDRDYNDDKSSADDVDDDDDAGFFSDIQGEKQSKAADLGCDCLRSHFPRNFMRPTFREPKSAKRDGAGSPKCVGALHISGKIEISVNL